MISPITFVPPLLFVKLQNYMFNIAIMLVGDGVFKCKNIAEELM